MHKAHKVFLTAKVNSHNYMYEGDFLSTMINMKLMIGVFSSKYSFLYYISTCRNGINLNFKLSENC